MSSAIEALERRRLTTVPRFRPGDRVRVHFQVVEGNRRRTQVFEGVVLKRQGAGLRETFTVRKHSFGVGVERTFPVHSPKVQNLEIVARGDVRRAKLYYLRGRIGKRARVAERRWGIEEEDVAPPEEPEALDSEGVTVSEAETMEPETPDEGEEPGEVTAEEGEEGGEAPGQAGEGGAEPEQGPEAAPAEESAGTEQIAEEQEAAPAAEREEAESEPGGARG